MRQQELENWLLASLDDFKLSQSEALDLREILPQLANDDIAFARNKAFQLAQDQGSDICSLIDHGVLVRMDSSANHMHHKFAIIDKKTLVNGSFNWTRSATDYNQENILVTDEPKLVNAYLAEFESLWLEFN